MGIGYYGYGIWGYGDMVGKPIAERPTGDVSPASKRLGRVQINLINRKKRIDQHKKTNFAFVLNLILYF